LILTYPRISPLVNAITRHSLCYITSGYVSFRPFNIIEIYL